MHFTKHMIPSSFKSMSKLIIKNVRHVSTKSVSLLYKPPYFHMRIQIHILTDTQYHHSFKHLHSPVTYCRFEELSPTRMGLWQLSRTLPITAKSAQVIHGPLTRYVKLQVAHAPGMPGTFSPAADFKENRLLAIPACITARA